MAVKLQFGINERLEQLQSHLLRQTALMQLEFRTDRNNRTAGIVNALAQQVLTETALFAFQHIGQRFQRTLIGAGNRAGTAAVVKQGINRFLQHAFFVADDNIRRMQFQQSFQTVIAVDDAAVQVVQVGSREAAAVQRNQRTQFRRNNRQNIKNHPLRFCIGINEILDNLQTLNQLFALGFRSVVFQLFANGVSFSFQIDGGQNFLQSLGTDAGAERIFAILVNGFLILFFSQQLINAQRCQTRFNNDVALEIQNAFQCLHRDIGQNRNPARQRFQEPNMSDRRGQLNMSHSFAANLGKRDFDAALFADDAAIFHSLVLSAQTLIVLDRTENAGAEQTVSLRLERTIVDGFRLFDFTVGP